MPSLAELEIMTQADLEAIISNEPASQTAHDARYILGKCQIEGCFPERIPRNEKKGIFWIKEAVLLKEVVLLPPELFSVAVTRKGFMKSSAPSLLSALFDGGAPADNCVPTCSSDISSA